MVDMAVIPAYDVHAVGSAHGMRAQGGIREAKKASSQGRRAAGAHRQDKWKVRPHAEQKVRCCTRTDHTKQTLQAEDSITDSRQCIMASTGDEKHMATTTY